MDTASLQATVASNARARGASSLCRSAFWDGALRLLTKASRVFIVTGFYIRASGACETDGPPGAVILGRALERAGKSVLLLTDRRNHKCLEACSRSVGGPAVACADDPSEVPLAGRRSGGSRPPAERSPSDGADLLIFIERPGAAADGRYYNMKGLDISDVVTPLDALAESAMRGGIPVLAIGDGGNEAGMGLLYDSLIEVLPNHYARCISKVPSDVCLPVDVSNWGGYALAALLSSFYRRWLGLDEGEEEEMLRALLEAGAVDGVSGAADMSVDGVPPGELNKVSLAIRSWYLRSL